MNYTEKRRVAFKEWIPVEYEVKEENNPFKDRTPIKGTNCYSDNELTGQFLQFIPSPSIDDYTIYALVEMHDGTIRRVDIEVMRFINQMKQIDKPMKDLE